MANDLNGRAAMHLRRGFAQFLRELTDEGMTDLPIGAEVSISERGHELAFDVVLAWRGDVPDEAGAEETTARKPGK